MRNQTRISPLVLATLTPLLITSCAQLDELQNGTLGTDGVPSALFSAVEGSVGSGSAESSSSIDVDLLFVVDTSTSYADNKKTIAAEISKFISAIPDTWNINFGVLAAHGPSSSSHGVLFESNESEGVVVSYNGGVGEYEARVALCQKFNGLGEDSSTDGGEAGILSLYEFLNSSSADKDSFFRDGSYQFYVFLSDENDLCSPHDGSSADELAAYDNHCQALVNAGSLDATSMLDLMESQYNPHSVSVAAVVSADESLTSSDSESDEYGKGYVDLVEAADPGYLLDLDEYSPSTGTSSDDFCETFIDPGIGV